MKSKKQFLVSEKAVRSLQSKEMYAEVCYTEGVGVKLRKLFNVLSQQIFICTGLNMWSSLFL